MPGLCRWGGEEFIFFFPDMNGDQVCEMLDMYCVCGWTTILFDWKGEWLKVTMTFGVEENDFTSSIDTLAEERG